MSKRKGSGKGFAPDTTSDAAFELLRTGECKTAIEAITQAGATITPNALNKRLRRSLEAQVDTPVPTPAATPASATRSQTTTPATRPTESGWAHRRPIQARPAGGRGSASAGFRANPVQAHKRRKVDYLLHNANQAAKDVAVKMAVEGYVLTKCCMCLQRSNNPFHYLTQLYIT